MKEFNYLFDKGKGKESAIKSGNPSMGKGRFGLPKRKTRKKTR